MPSINLIQQQALSLGFSAVGFAPAELPESVSQGLQEFIEAGHHGDMKWMEERAHQRSQPKALWPEAKSVIVVAHNYGPEADPMEKLAHKNTGNISAYALNLDYHDVIKKKLKTLARFVASEYACDVKVFVDTAPVMEKPLAELAGIGWQGKHTCVVSKDYGSWLFLGCIFTTLNLVPSTQTGNHCGSCTRCLDICPTQAFTGPGKLDATKCLAYLTIEHKGIIPEPYRKAMGNRIYGCDDCLAICPWNKFASVAHDASYHARESLKAPDLGELALLDDTAFRAFFSKSPIKRIGRNKFVSNVLIAIGNSGNRKFIPVVEQCVLDDSEIVQEAACWAKAELEISPISPTIKSYSGDAHG